jgi:hypothetical protein
MKSLLKAKDRVGCSRARSWVAAAASRSALPRSRGKPVIHAVRILRLATARQRTAQRRAGGRGLGSRNTLSWHVLHAVSEPSWDISGDKLIMPKATRK